MITLHRDILDFVTAQKDSRNIWVRRSLDKLQHVYLIHEGVCFSLCGKNVADSFQRYKWIDDNKSKKCAVCEKMLIMIELGR